MPKYFIHKEIMYIFEIELPLINEMLLVSLSKVENSITKRIMD